MFSSKKIEEYIESKLSGIFRVKMVLGSMGDPFYAYVTFISIKQCNKTH